MPHIKRPNYEPDPEEFKGAFQASGWRGVAWHILGWEVQPTEDTEWDGIEERTGRIVAVMVGDDTRHSLDYGDMTRLKRSEYCGGCGQIGCGCDPGGEEEEEEETTERELQCDMERDCGETIAMLDDKGFIYCAPHGMRRRNSGIRCRKLRPAEVAKLKRGETLKY